MTHTTFDEIQTRLTLNLRQQRDTLKQQFDFAKSQYTIACENYGNCSKQAGSYDKIVCALQTAIEALAEVTATKDNAPLREVYVPMDAELVNGVPASFIEFTEFWDTHTTDDGFVLVYLDTNNHFVN